MNTVVKSICSKLTGRVFRIRVNGPINQKLQDTIFKGLTKSYYKPDAILVSVNSSGGSLTSAKNISDILKLYSNKHNAPFITFVEDQCLGSANLLLTSASKCYANEFSMIGDIGYSWNSLWFKKFAEKYDIGQQFIHAGQNKVKMNPFQDLLPQSQKWMQNFLYAKEHELKVGIVNNRAEYFEKLKMTKEDIEEKILNAGIIEPEQAIKAGFIDGIKSMDTQINDKYTTKKIVQINKPKKGLAQMLQGAF